MSPSTALAAVSGDDSGPDAGGKHRRREGAGDNLGNSDNREGEEPSSPPPPPPSKRPRHSDEPDQRVQEGQKRKPAAATGTAADVPDPIVPSLVDEKTSSRSNGPSAGQWVVRNGCVLVRIPKSFASAAKSSFFAAPATKKAAAKKKKKVAAFDLDGTLLLWRVDGWPTRPDQYELWSSAVVRKLQDAIDKEKHDLLVIVSNQGGIRSAVTGKTADKVRGLINWIAAQVDRPLAAVVSTTSRSGYHKPSPKMWTVLEQELRATFDVEGSFFVGDSDGSDDAGTDEYQKLGVDRQFAANVGMPFYSPGEYFGASDMSRRQLVDRSSWASYDAPPSEALAIRRGLTGGYYLSSTTRPILIVLCGVQGSGKSTFCSALVEDDVASERQHDSSIQDKRRWVSYSQDTIGKDGKPGKREAVEDAVRQALRKGWSVVVDRTHIDAGQRSYFVNIGRELKASVHAVVLNPPESTILERVRSRTGHAGGVEGDKGAKLASMFIKKMSLPQYREGFDLITLASTDNAAKTLCEQYKGESSRSSYAIPRPIANDGGDVSLPMMILGTMAVSKGNTEKFVTSAIQHGFAAIDTAPTYKNEEEVGSAIQNYNGKASPFVVVKVPKRATQSNQVRDEVLRSLKNLGVQSVGLIILHWPCDFIEAGTLASAWQELEKIHSEGLCKYIGVSNFSVDALRSLLPHCRVKPVVNQVERHPLLPQWELFDFCFNQGIELQAHTPLGHGSASLLEHEIVRRIVKERGNSVSPAQILLMWNLQQGVANVVKCSSEMHQREAIHCYRSYSEHSKVFESATAVGRDQPVPLSLTPHELKLLDSIGIEDNNQHRFVAPPFMYKPKAPYSWGERGR